MTSTPPSDDTPCVLAIDPGREKTGVAIVLPNGECPHREIAPTEHVPTRVASLVSEWRPRAVVLGDRTGADAAAASLGGAGLPPVTRVDEHRSTEEARALYLACEPARGLTRLLPRGLRVPPRPVDDYAAWVLGRRYYKTP